MAGSPDLYRGLHTLLDNVLTDFINKAPDSMSRAKYGAMRERSIGLGVMGYHSFLQSKMIPMESVMAKVWNRRMFQHIKRQVDDASIKLAHERGACPDAADYGIMERFSNKMAIAPTASISIITGGTSPGIEPNAANAYNHKTLSGSFAVKNPYLEKLLETKGMNNEDVWSSIFTDEGSVQHLDFLSQDEKDVFKTAFEIDQRWLIEHAADRTPYICQAQSLNLFLPANVHKKDLHGLHMESVEKRREITFTTAVPNPSSAPSRPPAGNAARMQPSWKATAIRNWANRVRTNTKNASPASSFSLLAKRPVFTGLFILELIRYSDCLIIKAAGALLVKDKRLRSDPQTCNG